MRRRASRVRRIVAPALTLLLLPAVAAAVAAAEGATAPALTLHDAVERALASYPAVGAARADLAAAGHAVGAAEGARLPSIAASASGVYHDKPTVVTPIHGFTPSQFPEFDRSVLQGAVTLDYTVLDGGERAGTIRRQTALRAAAGAALDGAEQATAARTSGAYLQVLTLERTLDAHRWRSEALEAERGRVAQRLAAGRAAEVELRRVEAAVAAARAERVRIDAALATARADLGRLIGAESAAAAALSVVPVALRDRALPGRDELATAALAANPDVARAAHALAAAEATMVVARALYRPRLRAVGNVLGFGSTGGSTFEEEWNAGLMFSVPLYDGGARPERIAGAQAARDAAAERLRLARLAVGEALDRALAAVGEHGARVESLGAAVTAFAEVTRIERLRLDAGVGTETDYLSSEADLLASRAQLAEAGNAEIAARVELARVAGSLDLGWFDRSIETTPSPSRGESSTGSLEAAP